MNTDPDILTVLEKLKTYYDKLEMESRSHERSLKSIRSVESFQEPSQRNNYRYSSKDELNNRLTNFLINIEEGTVVGYLA